MSGLRTPHNAQRGAGMLMAVVFLLIVIALFGFVGLRMAGTDITDTSLQNDSVEALFLAESGLERAAQRLVAGTGCMALAPDAAQELGRGDFQILSGEVVGPLCRVHVLGRVLLGGQLRAQRLIEGDIQVGGGNTWAVGNNGTIRRWDGSTWFNSASGVTVTLNDVTCASANSCWTVGNNRTVLHWNGSAWVAANAGIWGGVTLISIACVPNSADDCIAVGRFGFGAGLVFQYNAGSWSLLDFNLFANYMDAHCTASECYAVGNNGLVGRRGGGWNLENANTGQNLYGVACSSASDCWAVGPRQGNSFFYDRRTGGGWNPQPPVNDPSNRRDLYDVSCPANNECWAVGQRRAGNEYTLTRWNGSNWSVSNFSRTGADNLNSVSCANTNDCWAVGNNGDALHWDGANWTFLATGTPRNLNGVYTSGGSGTTALVRWHEIIR